MEFFNVAIPGWSKSLLSILGVAMTCAANAQFFIETVEVLPANPSNTEETRLIIKMVYDWSACDYNSNNFIIEADSVRVNEYFDCGVGFGYPFIKRDTVNLGILLAQSDNCKLHCNRQMPH